MADVIKTVGSVEITRDGKYYKAICTGWSIYKVVHCGFVEYDMELNRVVLLAQAHMRDDH